MDIDQLDREILEILQVNADITNEKLADRIHVSAATCQRRVKRLKTIGAIEKVVAIVNPKTLVAPLIAIVEVSMECQTIETLSAFEALVNQLSAAQQCYRVSTGPDFVLVLALRDMQDYQDVASVLFSSINQVRNVRTFFSVHRSKFSTTIPIQRKLD